ncbi:post-transcriptional regulator [Alkalibacillus salilacus]|uniref:Post-transcriptional regulator n=1 Tax=Alkalibacillus salilacus TaxID=284582 RepID=A0ABT9VCS2_9BACI|nr:post-transcriptional regulator [Alkalibacillus salilacus]MDQ0158732.1 hypothetical protein [Alkalibacillus salilacus]
MEPIKKHVETWRPELDHVIQSKVEELTLLGYDEVTHEDVWFCLNQKVWRKNKELTLHEVVQDILHMSDQLFMSYLTVQAQQDTGNLMEHIEALTNGEPEQTK